MSEEFTSNPAHARYTAARAQASENLRFRTTGATPAEDRILAGHGEAVSHLFARFHSGTHFHESLWLSSLPTRMAQSAPFEFMGGGLKPVERTALGAPLQARNIPVSGVARYMFDAMHYTFGADAVADMRNTPSMADRVLRPVVAVVYNYGLPGVVDRVVNVLSTCMVPSHRMEGENILGLTLRPDELAQTPLQALAHTAVFVAESMGDVNRNPQSPVIMRAWGMAYSAAKRHQAADLDIPMVAGEGGPQRPTDAEMWASNVYMAGVGQPEKPGGQQ